MVAKQKVIRSIAIAGTSALLVAAVSADDQKVELSAVPAPVKAVIGQHTAQGATVSEIELENEDGKQVYSVEFMKDGKKTEFEISADGKSVKEDREDADEKEGKDDDDDEGEEQAIEAAAVPAAVKSAVDGQAKGAAIEKWTKETGDGAVAYEAEYKAGDRKHSVKVAEDGSIVEVESPAADLPAAVAGAVKKKYPAATVKKSEAVQVHFYEVKLDDGGKGREVKVDASGKILGSETEDED